MYGYPQITGNNRTALVTAMNDLLAAEPPAGRSPEAHAYLQRFAVDILDMFRPQNDTALGMKLISVSSTEPKNPDLIALYSASRLASMGTDLKGQVGCPEQVLDSWSKRVLEAFEAGASRDSKRSIVPLLPRRSRRSRRTTQENDRDEAGHAMSILEMENEGMDGMDEYEMEDMGMEMMDEMGDDDMEMEMMGMGMGRIASEAKPQPPEVLISRRKLNLVLQQVHLGVTGVAAAGLPAQDPGGLLASVAEDQKPLVEKWVTAMEPIVLGINDTMLDDRKKYVAGLEAQLLALQEFVGVEEEAGADADAGLPPELDPLAPGDPAAAAAAVPAAAAAVPAAAPAAAAAPVDELSPPVDELAAP